MPSASPSATATITISSSTEPAADWGFFATDMALPGVGGRLVPGGRSLRSVGGRLFGRRRRVLLGDALGVHRGLDGSSLRLQLGGRIVQQAGLHHFLRPDVAALADAGGLADAAAQVVELGAADVTAGGHLDALDL